MDCDFCKERLEPAGVIVFCAACGAPALAGSPDHPRFAFDAFGLSPGFTVDEGALEARYFELSKRLHPDRFASSAKPELYTKILQLAAVLNTAYQTLRRPEERLESLLRITGAAPSPGGAQNASSGEVPPLELADEFFEIQEAFLDNPEETTETARRFAERMAAEHQRLTKETLARAGETDWSTPSPTHLQKILELRKRRSYVRSMLENLERIGVGGACTRFGERRGNAR